MIHNLLSKLDHVMGFETAQAHCDVPCGIYDPHLAEVAALTVIRMIDLMGELKNTHQPGTPDYEHSFTRYVMVKEEHGELLKREIRVIYGDYFKKDMIDKYPELPDLVQKIYQLASKSRQTTSRDAAVDLLNQVNRFAEIFWETKGVPSKKVKAPYKPGEEMVLPAL
jgi:nickel superoxide dismutase